MQLLNNNPNVASATQEIAKFNGDGNAAVYNKARSMGYSDAEIDRFINKLYSMFGGHF